MAGIVVWCCGSGGDGSGSGRGSGGGGKGSGSGSGCRGHSLALLTPRGHSGWELAMGGQGL